MADVDSSLPVRSEADADQRVQVKLVDMTTPTQGASVDSSGRQLTRIVGINPAAAETRVKLSELGYANTDGFYHATNNTLPTTAGLIGHTRAGSPAVTDQIKKLTAITNSTVHALDISLHDEDGAAYSAANPLPVTMAADSAGDPVNSYDTSSGIAAAASDNHDYTVTAAVSLYLKQVCATASGRMKVEVQLETAAASGVFTTFMVGFTSTANPTVVLPFPDTIVQVTGAKVRVIRTNRDEAAMDVYSTISGIEA